MAPKRRLPSSGIERRVRARREEEWELGPEESEHSASEDDDESVSEEEVAGQHDQDSDEEDDESGSGSDNDSDTSAPPAPKVDFSSVSFGALARAQASLPPSEKKSRRSNSKSTPNEDDAPREIPVRTPRSKDEPKPKRSSKHAPQEQTSKRPVSRRREILPDTRRKARDPRFDPLVGGGRMDEAKARKAYAFLDEVRDGEMADLRKQIKKTKDVAQKEVLKRQLMSMESRRKAQKRKDEEAELLREHRAREKELVAQGKQPFYLKRSEQKKQLLVERYQSMSKGQVDRAIERKRKKVAGKEKKELDSLQRVRPRG